MNEKSWTSLPAERRRVLLRQYCVPLATVEEYITYKWVTLPKWLRDDLEG